MTETGCKQSAHFHHLVVRGSNSRVIVGGNKYTYNRIMGHCISGLTSLTGTVGTVVNGNTLSNQVNLISYDGTGTSGTGFGDITVHLPPANDDINVVLVNNTNFSQGSSTSKLVIKCQGQDIFEDKSYIEFLKRNEGASVTSVNSDGTRNVPTPPFAADAEEQLYNNIDMNKSNNSNTLTYTPIEGAGSPEQEGETARKALLSKHNLFNKGNKLGFVCTGDGKWKLSSLLSLGVGSDSDYSGSTLTIGQTFRPTSPGIEIRSTGTPFICGFEFSQS